MIKDFKCIQCGLCCKYLDDAFYTTVKEEDLKRWEKNSDSGILKRLLSIYIGNNQYVYDMWCHPESGEKYSYCPWLRREKANKYKYYCKIHDTKPEHCRNYPVDREQAIMFSCPALKPKNPEEEKIRRLYSIHLVIPDLVYKGFLAKTDYNKDTGVFKVKIFYVNNVNLEEYKYSDKNVRTKFQTNGPKDLEKEFHTWVNNHLKDK